MTDEASVPDGLPDERVVVASESTESETPPTRVLVVRDPTRTQRLRPVREIAERTTIGEAYLGSLVRTQLTLALRLLAVAAVALAGVPLMMWLEPSLRRVKVAGVPLGWLIVGVGFYPLFLFLAFVFIRRTERNEAEFIELVTGRPAGAVDAGSSIEGRG